MLLVLHFFVSNSSAGFNLAALTLLCTLPTVRDACPPSRHLLGWQHAPDAHRGSHQRPHLPAGRQRWRALDVGGVRAVQEQGATNSAAAGAQASNAKADASAAGVL
jgi:hypothetical protein